MAGGNAESFRALADAISRGDAEDAVARVHPEVRFETLRSAVQGAYRGRQGARDFMRDNEESFALFEPTYSAIEELSGDRIIAVGAIRVRGRGSGAETTVPTAAVAEFRDGLLWRYKDYGDEDAARAAVG